jgi:hypothetical protein
MLGVMKKQLDINKIPWGYELCFNADCQLREKCLRYQAYLLKPAERLGGPAVYPDAWKNGECSRFCEDKLVQVAWGFSKIYKNVPHYQRPEARRCVKNYFSSGNGPYYRYHHGENKLSPSQQQDIMNILAKFGPTDGLAFDHYETSFNFT